MTKPIVFLLGVGTALLFGSLTAHEPASRPAKTAAETGLPDQVIREAMEQLKTGNVATMLEVLTRKSVLPGEDLSRTVEVLKSGRTLFFNRESGKPIGECELIRKERVGDSLMRFVILEKLERAVMIWTIRFYRLKGEWYFQGFDASDKADVFFQPAAR